MNYITTTQLRTKSSELVNTLLAGGSVDLIHRSKKIGKIAPESQPTQKFDADKFTKIVSKMKLSPLTPEEIDKRYRAAMIKKHGKYLR